MTTRQPNEPEMSCWAPVPHADEYAMEKARKEGRRYLAAIVGLVLLIVGGIAWLWN